MAQPQQRWRRASPAEQQQQHLHTQQRRSWAAAATIAVSALLMGLLPSEACQPEHSIAPTSKGRKGIKTQINILGDANSMARLQAYSLPWISKLERSHTEINVFFGLGSESPSHALQLQMLVDNIIYLQGNTPAERFISLVTHVAVLSSCEIDWFVFIDDDTLFFPSSLEAVLRKYDPSQKLYIGNGSEERIQVALHGWFAQGGGGIVASRALLDGFEKHMVASGCLGNASAIHGDERFRDCVAALGGVPLTVEPGLHQMDIRGDLSGFMEGYAAMTRPLVSLHHLGMGDVQLMPDRSNSEAAGAIIRAHTGMPRAFLKRFVMRLQQPPMTIMLTMGYSVQVVQRYVTDEELQQTEATMSPWRLQGWDHVEFRGYQFPSRAKEVSKSAYYFQDYYKLLGLQVYGDQGRNTVLVLCGMCRNVSPMCLKPTNTTRSQMVLMLHSTYCEHA